MIRSSAYTLILKAFVEFISHKEGRFDCELDQLDRAISEFCYSYDCALFPIKEVYFFDDVNHVIHMQIVTGNLPHGEPEFEEIPFGEAVPSKSDPRLWDVEFY